jgi:hypothetical protein
MKIDEFHVSNFQKVNIAKMYHSLEIWAQTMSGAGATPFCEELALKQGKVRSQLI